MNLHDNNPVLSTENDIENYINNLITNLFTNINLDTITELDNANILDLPLIINKLEHGILNLNLNMVVVDQKIDKYKSRHVLLQQTFNKKLEEVKTTLSNRIIPEFKRLDANLLKAGNEIERIGGQLEIHNKHMNCSQQGKELIHYFLDLNTESKPIPSIFEAHDQTTLIEAAKVIHSLSSSLGNDQELNNSITVTKLANTRIATIRNAIENKLLKEFYVAYKEKDEKTISKIAQTLQLFSSGDSLIRRYVYELTHNLQPYLLSKSFQSSTQDQCITELNTFYSLIFNIVQNEHDFIQRVFPNPNTVISTLLQRIFEDHISAFIDSLFSRDSLKLADQLSLLQISYEKTLDLSNSIKKVCKSEFELNELVQTVFYKRRENYITMELKLFNLFANNKIGKSIESLESLFSKRKDFFGHYEKSRPELEARILELLNNDFFSRILDASIQSVKRSQFLSELNQDEHIRVLLQALLNQLIDNYFIHIFKFIWELLLDIDDKNEPSLFLFSIISSLNRKIARLNFEYKETFLPLISSLNIKTVIITEKRSSLFQIEQIVLNCLNRYIEILVKLTVKTLSQQKKSDFNIKDEIDKDELVPTSPCSAATTMINKYREVAVNNLEGRNLDSFLTVLGHKLCFLLSSHFEKFTISTFGAVQFGKDFQQYHTCFVEFKIPSVITYFEQIRSIGSLFLVLPENLKNLIEKDPVLRSIQPSKLLKLVELRTDAKVAKNFIAEFIK